MELALLRDEDRMQTRLQEAVVLSRAKIEPQVLFSGTKSHFEG
jgi:hypothetical protein